MADAAAALDINVFGTGCTSEVVARKEVGRMSEKRGVRVTEYRLGIWLRLKLIVLAAAVFLITGYGDGFSPSA